MNHLCVGIQRFINDEKKLGLDLVVKVYRDEFDVPHMYYKLKEEGTCLREVRFPVHYCPYCGARL